VAYLNVDEIETALENLAAAYPATTELITVPHLTHEGRQTHVLRLGATDSEQDSVLILGGVHAREWVPPDALISLAADLLEAYDRETGLVYGGTGFAASDIRQLMQALNVYVYPCVNPDGRHFSQTADPLWRKNRRPSGGGCVGVDINRNFDFLWDHLVKFAADSGVSASADPCNRTIYRGPAPASEAETRNVVWLLDSIPQIRWHIDVHSAVPVILHSWGSDENQTVKTSQNFLNSTFDQIRGRRDASAYGEYISDDDLNIVTSLSHRMDKAISEVRGVGYGIEQAYGLYPTSGASDDYAFSRHFADNTRTKVYGFTIECGRSFQPTWDEAEDVIREVCAGLIAFCLAATGYST
jgi:murein tripeptide amidase MpaA